MLGKNYMFKIVCTSCLIRVPSSSPIENFSCPHMEEAMRTNSRYSITI